MAVTQQLLNAVGACMMQLVEDEDQEPVVFQAAQTGEQEASFHLAVAEAAGSQQKLQGCVEDFFEVVVPGYSDESFRSHFRMSRHAMQILCNELEPHLQPAVKGYLHVSIEKKVHMTVWYLSNQETFRQLANLFGMPHKSTAHYCVMQVCEAIAAKLRQTYIRWPTDAEQQVIANEFEAKFGFPDVIGCIDGTHVAIKPPAADRDSYINRKGYPSVNVMAVCDNRMIFTEVFADRAGSVHDARVLRVSPLGPTLERSQIGQEKFHILGDSACPLLPQLLVPFRDNGHLNATQMKYNRIHAETRAIIERAFARLKGKMRCLKFVDCTRITNALVVIESAFILHNFIIIHDNSNTDLDLDIDNDDNMPNNPQDNGAANVSAVRQLAVSKRDRIAVLF